MDAADADDDAPDPSTLSKALTGAYRRLTSDQLERIHHKYSVLLAKIKLRGDVPSDEDLPLIRTSETHLRVINDLLHRRQNERHVR